MDTTLYKKSLQKKREASRAMHKLAYDLELCESEVDWQLILEKYNGHSLTGDWLTFKVDGVLVQLHLATMCLLANAGGGVVAQARYLLDMRVQEIAHKAALTNNYKKED